MQDLHSLSFPFLRSSTVTSAREYLTYENLIHFKLPRRVYLIRRLIPDSGAMCTEKIARVESGVSRPFIETERLIVKSRHGTDYQIK